MKHIRIRKVNVSLYYTAIAAACIYCIIYQRPLEAKKYFLQWNGNYYLCYPV